MCRHSCKTMRILESAYSLLCSCGRQYRSIERGWRSEKHFETLMAKAPVFLRSFVLELWTLDVDVVSSAVFP